MPINERNSLYWLFHDHFINNLEWTRTCIDVQIYSRWRTLRLTGSAKPGGVRIMKPCRVTGYWEAKAKTLGLPTADAEAMVNFSNGITDEQRLFWMDHVLNLKPVRVILEQVNRGKIDTFHIINLITNNPN